MAVTRIPRSAKAARDQGYTKIAGKHSVVEKKKRVLIKKRGTWSLARAASAAPSGSHTVCYYDPNTGFYDDCHQSS